MAKKKNRPTKFTAPQEKITSLLKIKKNETKGILGFFLDNSLSFAFLVATAATLGSLYYSEVLKVPPCLLCWYQRIFMYPLVLILGIAVYQNDTSVKKYVIPLSLIGLAIAVYHYLLQLFPLPYLPCSNETISCTSRNIEYFGFITIPFMAITAFFFITVFAILQRKN